MYGRTGPSSEITRASAASPTIVVASQRRLVAELDRPADGIRVAPDRARHRAVHNRDAKRPSGVGV